MSEIYTEEIDDIAWEDVALRKIFLECLASSNSSTSISSFSSLPSTSSEVSVYTLVDYIRDNASENYRNKTLLDELQKSIEEVTSNGQVNWPLFKKASRLWVTKVLRNRQQDSNNNIAKDDSHDGSVGRYDDEKRVSGDGGESDREIGNLEDLCRKKPKTPRRFVTADFVNLSNVSSYSPSSDTHGCAMFDSTPDSVDEMDAGISCNEVSQVDLRLRVRRFDEENALLREELVRAEELATGLQRKFEKLQRKLEQTTDRCRQLERENDEYKEILTENEVKERECRWALQKIEKERGLLAKKLEDSETDRQQIMSLTVKLEKYKKEKLDYTREATKCQQALELKQAECEMLWKKLVQIEEANDTLSESYEKTIRHLREKNNELKSQIFDLQIQRGVENPSDVVCSTPATSYLHSYMQSTPHNDGIDSQLQDSLYSELKASGFSVDESKLHDLEDELAWYHEEVCDAVKHIDNILERINQQRQIPHVPDLSLEESTSVNTADICAFQQKLSRLSNMVNEILWKPKVKDANSQIYAFSSQTEHPICSQYGIPSFEDSLRFSKEKLVSEAEVPSREDNNVQRKRDVFVETFSMNSRSSSDHVQEVKVTESKENNGETDELSAVSKGSMLASCGIQEHTIIDPIVDEIDRILQCTNKCGEEAPTKNPRYRCIYTCTQPADDLTALKNSVRDSTLNSPKRLEREFAATYVISSGGDAPPPGMVNHSNTSKDNTVDQSDLIVKSVTREETSNTFNENFISESMHESTNLEDTKPLENETLAEELNDSELGNLSTLSPSSTIAEPSTPVNKLFVVGRSVPLTETTYCTTPNQAIRNFPKRKISVFHRSFDIDTLHEGAGSDTYRLTERSMSTPGNSGPEKRDDESMERDLDCIKYTPGTRNILLNTYRTTDSNSDSSESPSPVKPFGLIQDNHDSPLGESPIRSRSKPLVLAPTKLKLPLLKEIPAYVDKSMEKNSKIDDNTKTNEANDKVEQSTNINVNETQATYDLTNVEAPENNLEVTDASFTSEMIRPGDEIHRGITYRRSSFSRDSDYLAYSLLSPLNDSSVDDKRIDRKIDSVSTIVFSDGESTSCDSSPKRELPIAQSTLKLPLVSTYEKPGERTYARQDPSKPRGGPCHVERTAGAVYQTRNDDIGKSSAGSYGSGGVSGVMCSSVEKANVVPAVAPAMSSGEDTSDSECDPMAIRAVDETRSISPTVQSFANGAVLGSSTPAPTIAKNGFADVRGDCSTRNPMAQKRDKRERLHTIRRSLSESGCGNFECSCRCCKTGNFVGAETNGEETRPMAFPSLTDARLQKSGIANLSSTDEIGGNLTEADLERKYTAFSVGLVTDRVTLPRRVALSIRQRDQSEINLASEVQKMQQDIQDLAPLCIDRESVERVERVRHQLEIINQCAHRISCTAETLGAVHQERRVSRAVLLADRYLLVLRSRCEKLISDLAETKRILTENNIVVEEHNGELGEDMPRIRYRGMPTNNRTMMARRRASIATIFRPLGNFQDVTKDGVRQRNSVSGRMTLRRPSLSAESQKWEAEKLDRTDSSSSSIGELREIFEQAESRRASREENNNVLRQHSSNLNVRDCEHADGEVWTIPWEEPVAELPAIVDGGQENRLARRTSLPYWSTNNNQIPWRLMFWCIMISFLLGFYMKHVVSSVNGCSSTPLKWWSFEEYFERYFTVRNDVQRPI